MHYLIKKYFEEIINILNSCKYFLHYSYYNYSIKNALGDLQYEEKICSFSYTNINNASNFEL